MKDGGAAFPRGSTYKIGENFTPTAFEGGMSLRDWFAGQALIGYLALHANSKIDIMPKPETVALYCYLFADAMLKEREKNENSS